MVKFVHSSKKNSFGSSFPSGTCFFLSFGSLFGSKVPSFLKKWAEYVKISKILL